MQMQWGLHHHGFVQRVSIGRVYAYPGSGFAPRTCSTRVHHVGHANQHQVSCIMAVSCLHLSAASYADEELLQYASCCCAILAYTQAFQTVSSVRHDISDMIMMRHLHGRSLHAWLGKLLLKQLVWQGAGQTSSIGSSCMKLLP